METVQAQPGLKEGQNYLYFRTADLLENQLTARSCLVTVICTSTYIFAIPIQQEKYDDLSNDGSKFRFVEGDEPMRGMERMMADPELNLEKMESNLLDLLDEMRPVKIFPVKELIDFKVEIGITGKTPLKMKDLPVQYMAVRGKGMKEVMKEFYQA